MDVMTRASRVLFDGFELDPEDEFVLRGGQRVPLTPKAFAVLRHLVGHAGRLVSKAQLLEAVWPGVYVSDAALKVCIREIRRALGDDARRPRLVRTEHRRGYTFVAPVTSGMDRAAVALPGARPGEAEAIVVGRGAELDTLQAALVRALAGQRQAVFVTGEAGIGKTALVDAFTALAAGTPGLWVARGQCLDRRESGESYLPVFEALGGLARSPAGHRLAALLARHAPTWLAKMPALEPAGGPATPDGDTSGAVRERMPREMADVLEALPADTGLVLVIEDLHDADGATLDLMRLVAQRRAPARLLALVTHRPVDAARGHPLRAVKQELVARRACAELPLEPLSAAAVAEFLAWRLDGRPVDESVARLVHQRTEGHPLFMVNVVDFLVDQALVVARPGGWTLAGLPDALARIVPERIRRMVDQQIDAVTDDEARVLEAASVDGVEFSAAAVASALDEDLLRVEEHCEAMVRRDVFLRRAGVAEWPDGTVTTRYRFVHALYRDVLHERPAAARRALLHRRIDERREAAWGEKPWAIAADEGDRERAAASRSTAAPVRRKLGESWTCSAPNGR
jgi:DNA-binding winged helix-turn-helix (wHTH) protein